MCHVFVLATFWSRSWSTTEQNEQQHEWHECSTGKYITRILCAYCSSVPLCLLFLCSSVPTVPLCLLFLYAYYSSMSTVPLFLCIIVICIVLTSVRSSYTSHKPLPWVVNFCLYFRRPMHNLTWRREKCRRMVRQMWNIVKQWVMR